mmetsp:Transcript_76357/g.218766  ORF Transcript_76357/g.218766 Transcript_76357/m.218766 type:complete len:191 (-) Transcript_76357:60-632(-)
MSSRGGVAGPMVPPLSPMARSASDSSLLRSAPTPIKRQSIQRRAAEIVALSTLMCHSGTGSLQHDHLRRVRTVLEATDELQCEEEAAGGRSRGRPSKEWTREMLQAEKKMARQKPPVEETKWVLRRGTWFYQGGPPEDKSITASEALEQFIAEEEARGRGPQYRNRVLGPPGQTRKWQKRNPVGGFYDEN